MKFLKSLAVVSALAAHTAALATPATETSPTGGALPAGVTRVGGLVVDLTGANGARVVSQLAASQMFVGFADQSSSTPGTASGNPLVFGTQNGFSAAIVNALGGGLSSASFRITLFDGDTAAGNFDFNQNTFLVDGITIGNWSDVATDVTSGDGMTSFGLDLGFRNNQLATGFFSLTNSGALASLFGALGDGSLAFSLNDTSPFDNFYDFTQGVDGGLINVGTGPVIQPPVGAVPEPATWAMMIGGFGMAGGALRYRRRWTNVSFA